MTSDKKSSTTQLTVELLGKENITEAECHQLVNENANTIKLRLFLPREVDGIISSKCIDILTNEINLIQVQGRVILDRVKISSLMIESVSSIKEIVDFLSKKAPSIKHLTMSKLTTDSNISEGSKQALSSLAHAMKDAKLESLNLSNNVLRSSLWSSFSTQTNIKSIILENVGIDDDSFFALNKELDAGSLTKLCLSNKSPSGSSIVNENEFMRNCINFRTLRWVNKQSVGQREVKYRSFPCLGFHDMAQKMLRFKGHLRHLEIEGAEIKDDQLFSILCKGLKVLFRLNFLKLKRLSIDGKRMQELGDALKEGRLPLQTLDLSSNGIGDAGAMVLSQLFADKLLMMNLKNLNIESNKISIVGGTLIFSSIGKKRELDVKINGNQLKMSKLVLDMAYQKDQAENDRKSISDQFEELLEQIGLVKDSDDLQNKVDNLTRDRDALISAFSVLGVAKEAKEHTLILERLHRIENALLGGVLPRDGEYNMPSKASRELNQSRSPRQLKPNRGTKQVTWEILTEAARIHGKKKDMGSLSSNGGNLDMHTSVPSLIVDQRPTTFKDVVEQVMQQKEAEITSELADDVETDSEDLRSDSNNDDDDNVESSMQYFVQSSKLLGPPKKNQPSLAELQQNMAVKMTGEAAASTLWSLSLKPVRESQSTREKEPNMIDRRSSLLKQESSKSIESGISRSIRSTTSKGERSTSSYGENIRSELAQTNSEQLCASLDEKATETESSSHTSLTYKSFEVSMPSQNSGKSNRHGLMLRQESLTSMSSANSSIPSATQNKEDKTRASIRYELQGLQTEGKRKMRERRKSMELNMTVTTSDESRKGQQRIERRSSLSNRTEYIDSASTLGQSQGVERGRVRNRRSSLTHQASASVITEQRAGRVQSSRVLRTNDGKDFSSSIAQKTNSQPNMTQPRMQRRSSLSTSASLVLEQQRPRSLQRAFISTPSAIISDVKIEALNDTISPEPRPRLLTDNSANMSRLPGVENPRPRITRRNSVSGIAFESNQSEFARSSNNSRRYSIHAVKDGPSLQNYMANRSQRNLMRGTSNDSSRDSSFKSTEGSAKSRSSWAAASSKSFKGLKNVLRRKSSNGKAQSNK